MINKELLDKFKKLYKDKFDITLSDEQATRLATDWVNLMKVLIKPETKPENSIRSPKEGEEDETSRILNY